MKTVLCFGEVLWDLLPGGPELGGAPGNFAFRIQSLGHRARLVSRVGTDDLGERTVALLQRNHLATDLIQRDGVLPTGTVKVAVNERGEPDFTILQGIAFDAIEATRALLEEVEDADCIYYGTLIQRAEKSRATLRQVLERARGALKVLDLNLRKDCYNSETINESLGCADILKLNDGEVDVLAKLFSLPCSEQEFATALIAKWGVKNCLITRGPNGAYARSHQGQECSVEGHQVQVADTCGAGDAFTAGFVARHLEGGDLVTCTRFGNALGALVATTRGGTAAVPREKVETLLNGLDEANRLP